MRLNGGLVVGDLFHKLIIENEKVEIFKQLTHDVAHLVHFGDEFRAQCKEISTDLASVLSILEVEP